MKRYEYNGRMCTINELSELSGIIPHTLRDRLRRGYSIEQAIKPTPTNESVESFCNDSWWEDWIGLSISYLYEIYWKWCVSSGYTPSPIQGFSRQLFKLYPNLKTVPIKKGDKSCRVIRLK